MSVDVPDLIDQAERPPPRMARLVTGVALLLAAVWAWSGVAKLLDPEAFAVVVMNHGVFPETAAWAAWAVGPVEVLLAIGIGVYAGRTRGPGLACTLVSLALIGVFSVYLLNVPEASLRAVGCGCRGSSLSGLDHQSRTVSLATNAGFALLHTPLLLRLGTGVVETPRPIGCASRS